MPGPRYRHARARCPGCGKELAVRTPAGGDGSCYVYPRHWPVPNVGRRCSWSRCEVDVRDQVADEAGIPPGRAPW